MPQDIQDTFSAKWEGKRFGQVTTGLIAAAGQEGNIDKLKKAGKTLDAALDTSMVNAAASIVTSLAKNITGDQITANDLFAGISGVVRNPNV